MNFKEGNWNPTSIEKDPQDLLDAKMAKRIVSDLRHQIPPGGFPKHKPVVSERNPGQPPKLKEKRSSVGNANPKKDQDLVSSMAARLAKIENLSNVQRKEIKEKTEMIEEMKKEIKTLKMAASPNYHEEIKKAQEENKNLKKENQEMKIFLKDYGLKWKGDGSHEGEFNMAALQNSMEGQGPIYRSNLPKEIDLEVIARRIEELNMVANRDAKQIVKKAGVHKIEVLAPLPIAMGFYKNGLILKGFPFRAYHSKEAQSILSDILDGYFPYDLKNKYPDGVAIKIVDHTEEIYTPQQKGQFRDFLNINDDELAPMSKDEYLKQLPEKVIKGGKIIPVREEVAKKFGDNPKPTVPSNINQTGVIEVETEIVKKMNSGIAVDEKDIVNLRIRTETGKRTLIVKMVVQDKIKDVYNAVNSYSESGAGNYQIRSTFPQKCFEISAAENLKDLGLAPKSVLVLQKK